MAALLLKALAFVFIMVLGYTLKKAHVFAPNSHSLISKIVMNITLPAAIITGFASFVVNPSIVFMIVLGFVCNVFMLVLGFLVARKKDVGTKAYCMLNYPGYNIGAFTMPFVQNFLGPLGIVVTSMFDAGNSIMCTGGSYAITSSVIGAGERTKIREIGKKLLSSAPFDTYLLLLILAFFKVHVPSSLVVVTSTIGNANGFLAMLMIGMMFEMKAEPKYIKQIASTLATRYVIAAVFAVVFYFLTPFSLPIRRVLAIVVFAPLSILTPIFTEKSQGDPALSSLTGSLSILISIVIITSLLVAVHIG